MSARRDSRGILYLLMFSIVIAVVLGLLFTGLLENTMFGYPDTPYGLFAVLMLSCLLTAFITVVVYTYYLRGRVSWIYY